ncbi:hypothetical protein [Bacillus sp. SN1]|uniref:hypothetical protein n=1 Tax=Bacillus sp. SN1 TaxID=2055158 RepID=UPI000C220C4A|nr:hypothetical protein [Bacillus sp. SN1]PJH94843.1 hypothetical protein CVV77_06460 [Bacillus sp. SN1]PSI05818.1 hypothetical protein C7H81_02235 [Bacillus subtilis]
MYNCYYVPMLMPNSIPTYNIERSTEDFSRQRRREIPLDIREASRADLGNGFYSYEWLNYVVINPNEYLVCVMAGQNINVINGGFAPRDLAPMYAMESFPRRKNQWVVTVHNPTGSSRELSLYLIAKT